MTYIALFDILGFRSFLQHTPLPGVIQKLEHLDSLISAAQIVPRLVKKKGVPPGAEFPPGIDPATTTYLMVDRQKACEAIRFSDTVLLYVDEQPGALENLILSAYQVLHHALNSGIPLRGVVTRGDLYVSPDKKTYVGKGLVRAHDLEQAQDWIGAVLDPDHVDMASLQPRFLERARETGVMLEYEAPMKEGAVRTYHCIGWPGGVWHDEDMLRQQLIAFSGPNDWRAKGKVERALDFRRAFHAARRRDAEGGPGRVADRSRKG